jgi:hypothetical protein
MSRLVLFIALCLSYFLVREFSVPCANLWAGHSAPSLMAPKKMKKKKKNMSHASHDTTPPLGSNMRCPSDVAVPAFVRRRTTTHPPLIYCTPPPPLVRLVWGLDTISDTQNSTRAELLVGWSSPHLPACFVRWGFWGVGHPARAPLCVTGAYYGRHCCWVFLGLPDG